MPKGSFSSFQLSPLGVLAHGTLDALCRCLGWERRNGPFSSPREQIEGSY